MTTPKRWIEPASEADDLERAVLRAGLEADPAPEREDEVWARVLGAVAAPPPPGGGEGALNGASEAATRAAGESAVAGSAAVLATVAPATLPVASLLGKGFVLGIAASVVVAGAGHFVTQPHRDAPAPGAKVRADESARSSGKPADTTGVPPQERVPEPDLAPSITPPATRPAPVVHPSRSEPEPAALHAPASAGGSVASFPPVPESNSETSRLGDEAWLLQRARSELRRGDLAAAYATLEASRRQFSEPALYQEREALSIELLSRSGEHAAARARARSFLERFPKSPHALQVERFLAHPQRSVR